MRSVYLDACAIIESRESAAPEGQAVINLIMEAGEREVTFLTSELSLLEALVKPVQGLVDRAPHGEDPTRRADHDWYQDNMLPDGLLFRTVPITRDILVQAALIRARVPSIKTPDAIHVATAYLQRCAYFVTGDDRLSKALARDPAWTRSDDRIIFVNLSVEALDALRAELRP